jgi:hypothetical protein
MGRLAAGTTDDWGADGLELDDSEGGIGKVMVEGKLARLARAKVLVCMWSAVALLLPVCYSEASGSRPARCSSLRRKDTVVCFEHWLG